MVAAHRRGVSVPTIAAGEGLTRQRVYQVLADWRDVPSVPPRDVVIDAGDEIRATLDAYGQALEDLGQIAASDAPWAVKLGAVKATIDVRERRLQLLASAGLIPRNLAAPQIEQEVAEVLAGAAEVLRRHRVAEEVIRDLLSEAETRMRGSLLIEVGEAVPA